MRKTGVLLFLIASIASADDIIDRAEYGTCDVLTFIDDFTDELRHRISCTESVSEYSSRSHWLAVECYAIGRWVTYLEVGDFVSHLNDTINVKTRFDRLEVFNEVWRWDREDRYAYHFSTELASDFIKGLATAERFVFQIDERTGKINFSDQTPSAVVELVSRCAETFQPEE